MLVNYDVGGTAGWSRRERTARRYNESVQLVQMHELEARIAIGAARLIPEAAAALRQLAQSAPALDRGRRVNVWFGCGLGVHAHRLCKTFAKPCTITRMNRLFFQAVISR